MWLCLWRVCLRMRVCVRLWCVCVWMCLCRICVRVWRVRAGHHWHADLRGKSFKKKHKEITQHNTKNVIITTTHFALKKLTIYSIKEAYNTPKEAHIPSDEYCTPYLYSRKETHISSIELYTSQKEPYTQLKRALHSSIDDRMFHHKT